MNGKEKQARNIVVMVTSEPVMTPAGQKSGADLLNLLSIGLLVMRPQWQYPTQDWGTCILGDDIDNDGDIEILLGSSDGHIYALAREGNLRWKRDLESKQWITSLAIIPSSREPLSSESKQAKQYSPSSNEQTPSHLKPRILVLTYSGELLVFDQNGTPLPEWHLQWEGLGSEPVKCPAITQICMYNGQLPTGQRHPKGALLIEGPMLIVGTNDQRIHLFDSITGGHYKAKELAGSIERICVADVNSDKQQKILVTTSNKCIYVLDQNLKVLETISLPYKSAVLVATNPFASIISTNKATAETIIGQLSSSPYLPTLYSGYNGRDLLCWTQKRSEICSPFEPYWPEPITFAGQPTVLAVADHGDDRQPEILVGCTDHCLYILDHKGKLLWKQDLGHTILSIYAHDYSDDDFVEVIVSLTNNTTRSLKLNLQPRKELYLTDMQQEEQDFLYEQIYSSWEEC